MAFVVCNSVSTASSCCVLSKTSHPATDAYDGWQLGTQAWSFKQFTFFEAVDKTHELGLSWIQAYPGQKIALNSDAKMSYDMSAELRQMIHEKLAQANVSIVAFGVVGVPQDESEARKLFNFAKEIGIGVIVSEPGEDQLDLIDKLCQEYQVKLAIHNHPQPSHYWNPETVLKAVQGRSKWIGACVDVGHWVRSGLYPVQCLKKLEGRIHDVHIKEIDKENNHDVVWGTAQGRIKGVLEELHRQGYQGTFAIEYEYNWDNNLPEIRRSIDYFNSVVSTLKPSGWRQLFAPDLSDAQIQPGGWKLEESILERIGEGDIWTKTQYSNFILDFDFKVESGSNSGIFLRTENHEWLPWLEVQIEDSYGKAVSRHICGAIFDIQAPKVNPVLPPGEWNHMTILAQESKIVIILNNQPIIDIDLNTWKQAGKNPDGSKNKFNIAYKDLPRKGYIGIQDHRDGTKVQYRNIKIKEL